MIQITKLSSLKEKKIYTKERKLASKMAKYSHMQYWIMKYIESMHRVRMSTCLYIPRTALMYLCASR